MDRYILAKLREYVADVDQAAWTPTTSRAPATRTQPFLEVLTNWYIRRSRERFWSTGGALDADAFDTLYTVLEVVCRVTAPLLPLTTEEVWRGLTGGRSVHLTDWPVDRGPAGRRRAAGSDGRGPRRVLGRARRCARPAACAPGCRSPRSPSSSPTRRSLAGFEGIIADELNVKQVRLLDADAPAAASYGVEQKLTVNARAAGPRLGKDVQAAIKGSKTGDWSVAEDGVVTSGGLVLEEGEFTLETVAAASDGHTATGLLPGGGFVVLDTEVTAELAAEGVARDLIRAVQQARKDAGLEVSDRIALTIGGSAEVQAAARAHEALICGETLAVSLTLVSAGGDGPRATGPRATASEGDGSGDQVRVTVVRA